MDIQALFPTISGQKLPPASAVPGFEQAWKTAQNGGEGPPSVTEPPSKPKVLGIQEASPAEPNALGKTPDLSDSTNNLPESADDKPETTVDATTASLLAVALQQPPISLVEEAALAGAPISISVEALDLLTPPAPPVASITAKTGQDLLTEVLESKATSLSSSPTPLTEERTAPVIDSIEKPVQTSQSDVELMLESSTQKVTSNSEIATKSVVTELNPSAIAGKLEGASTPATAIESNAVVQQRAEALNVKPTMTETTPTASPIDNNQNASASATPQSSTPQSATPQSATPQSVNAGQVVATAPVIKDQQAEGKLVANTTLETVNSESAEPEPSTESASVQVNSAKQSKSGAQFSKESAFGSESGKALVFESKSASGKDAVANDDSIPTLTILRSVQETNTLVVPKPLNQANLIEDLGARIAERIELLSTLSKPTTVVIRLNPNDLGTIDLTVRGRGGRVEAEITASNPMVAEALRAGSSLIGKQLEVKGFDLTQFQVSQASDQASFSQQQRSEHQSHTHTTNKTNDFQSMTLKSESSAAVRARWSSAKTVDVTI